MNEPAANHQKNSGAIFILLTGMALLVASYVGTYFWLLDDTRDWTMLPGPSAKSIPRYRVAHDLCDKVFYPVHLADRRVRRERWLTLAIDGIEVKENH